YLKRLQLQNSFWGDDIRLEGVQIMVPGAKIVTTQPERGGANAGFFERLFVRRIWFPKIENPSDGLL
ncbi:MAG: hypothetical protein ACKOEZ_01730, partial [Spartobacteria bacterium]